MKQIAQPHLISTSATDLRSPATICYSTSPPSTSFTSRTDPTLPGKAPVTRRHMAGPNRQQSRPLDGQTTIQAAPGPDQETINTSLLPRRPTENFSRCYVKQTNKYHKLHSTAIRDLTSPQHNLTRQQWVLSGPSTLVAAVLASPWALIDMGFVNRC